MSSYALFGRSSIALGDRSEWIGSAGANVQLGTLFGGAPASAFNADVATTPGTVLEGSAAADYAADGVLRRSTVAMFDLSQSSPGVFSSGAPEALNRAISTDAPLFDSTTTRLDPSASIVASALHLALSDRNWNAIKNLEVKVDSVPSPGTFSEFTRFSEIHLKNFVDTRLKLGDDPSILFDPNTQGIFYDVHIAGVKRGEVDASLFNLHLNVQIDLWSNGPGWQNTFNILGSALHDTIIIGPDTLIGSPFGNKAGHPGYDDDGTYDGRFTTVVANLGATYDAYIADDSNFDQLTNIPFQTTDRVWGGTGGDLIQTGAGDDVLIGDNGTGKDFRPDPARFVEVSIGYFDSVLATGVGEVPRFDLGQAPREIGASVDFDRFTVSASGGELIQLKIGGGFSGQTGGFGIRSVDDSPASAADTEIDGRGHAESLTVTFKEPAFAVDLNLNALRFDEVPLPGGGSDIALERALYRAELNDGSSLEGTVEGTPFNDGNVTISVGLEQTAGRMIKSISVRPATGAEDGAASSDFYLGGLIARIPVDGQPGNDVLIAGPGADWLEGGRDTGRIPAEGSLVQSFGDQMLLGLDEDRDTVNFFDGDGLDIVRQFDPRHDLLRLQGNEQVSRSVVADSFFGAGTLVRHGDDGDGLFLIGITDPAAVRIDLF